MPTPSSPSILDLVKEEALVYGMDGGDWIWMIFMMVFLLVALVALIYLAVRLAGSAADHNPEARR